LIMPTAIVAYLMLFVTVGMIFLVVALILGRLFRPTAPSTEKSEVYECGEPPVGTGFVQFDLRFYVMALLFIIFEVELAFFFPPAVVFGKLNQIAGGDLNARAAAEKIAELGVSQPGGETNLSELQTNARTLAAAAIIDMGVFFAVLLAGFAYLWKRGDLDWVRTVKKG
jgi:NADH-quinone oxidoreductase subunit A